MKMFNKLLVGAGALAVSALSMAAPAAAIDVTDFTTSLSNQLTSVTAVVAASFVLLGVITGVKYIRRAAK